MMKVLWKNFLAWSSTGRILIILLIYIGLFGIVMAITSCSTTIPQRQGGFDIQGHQQGSPGNICAGQHSYVAADDIIYCWGED